jgi:hypothetical protein
MIIFDILNVRNCVLNLEDRCRIMLKWIFKKCDGEAWIGLIWLRMGAGVGRL